MFSSLPPQTPPPHRTMLTTMLLAVLLQASLRLAVVASPMLSSSPSSAMSRLQCMDSSSCTRTASKKLVECHFHLRNQTRNVNGTPRTMQLINGQFPGPCVQAMLGDRIDVHVVNQASTPDVYSQNVSLHWHGLHLRGAPQYDGTPLTQCPIGQGARMTYRVPADVAGTHMYHSHTKLSMLDGVWGPLIVHDDADPYLHAYDEERVISVTDFANETAAAQFAHWKAFESAYYYKQTPDFGVDPYPGRWYAPGAANGGRSDYYNWTYGIDGALIGVIPWVGGLINGKTLNTSDPAVVQVEAGKRYRLRILSPSAFYPLEVSVDGHRLDVIAADGSSVVRTGPFDRLNIHGGERYDVVLNATVGKPGDRFWIRARTQEKDLPWHQVLAVLSYGSNSTTPLPPSTSVYKGNVTGVRYVNCFHDVGPDCVPASALQPHASEARSVGPADVDVAMHLKFTHGPLINGVRFAEPETPPLFSKGNTLTLPGVWPCAANTTYDGCSAQFGCDCTQVITLEYNKQVRLTIDNLWPTTAAGVTSVHPFHLHGHKFALLGMGFNGGYTGQALNTRNPSWRDDVIVPAGGWIVAQFTSDNPGAWMGHCHMEHHLNDGMSVLFSEALDRLADLTPPKDFAYCRKWNSTAYEGTAESEPTYEANPAVF